MIYRKKLLVFIGPDGSGKTTAINHLNERIKSSYNVSKHTTTFDNIIRFDHLYNKIKNLLFSTEAKKFSQKTSKNKEYDENKLIPFWKIIIILLYESIDYIIGNLMMFSINKKSVVLFDRYVYEYYTEPNYLNNRIGFMKFIMKIAPKPDYIFYLNNSPTVIRKRKQELSIEQIDLVQSRVIELLSNMDNFIVIDTTESSETITNQIISTACLKKSDI